MKTICTLFLIIFVVSANAQLLNWVPQFPTDESSVIITVDATRGNKGLEGYTGTVYMHFGVITDSSSSPSDWRYVVTEWGTTTAPAATPVGTNKWSITINNPRAYFGVPSNEKISRIALISRNASGDRAQKNADGSDMYVPVYPAGIKGIQFTQPFILPTYNLSKEEIKAGVGVSVPVTATASASDGTLNLYFNGTKISGPVTGNTTISGSAAATVKGNQQFIAEYITTNATLYDTIDYYIAPDNTIASLPEGVKEGINYGLDCTSSTLVLFAPNKNHIVVVGDFPGSNWTAKPEFQMNKTPDGNYYWLTVTGLTSGTEYAFNYRVDDSIYVADPYTEKVLDPYNDKFTPDVTYPNLKPYPVKYNVSAAKNGMLSVLQTCEPAYNWKVSNFVKPDKRNLITYELLVRDFADTGNYQLLIDTINYFKRLGINAIELMPVNEFSGNNSWGYNPTFYCALDKAYGTKNKFKEFIDLCHQNGIAVILDVVYNHMDAFSTPQGKMYWSNGKPAANSPWFNVTAPHAYAFFEDLNHTSTATQYLVKRSLDYWLNEYKIDGYRFDLGKGFTQTPSNETTIENYDASRVANLERYYDHVVLTHPDTYMIIEFLGTQKEEEQEYARHGFMLWGKNTDTYNQATMGYKENSNSSKIVYNSSEAGFTTMANVGYMESHDEERLMFKNLAFGNKNSSGTYDVKNLATALERQAAAAAVFFTVPGPKLIWQFGERGYQISINDFGGRVSPKPPLWEQMKEPDRIKLWNVYSKLIHFRLQHPGVFNSTSFSYDFYDNEGLFRRLQIADPNQGGMKVTVVANFDVIPQTRTVTFQSTGTWYSFVGNGTGSGLNGGAGASVDIPSAEQSITLQPGEYHVYVDRAVVLPLRLLQFTAHRSSSSIELRWLTEKETNVKQFEIERSFNGSNFAGIGTAAAANNSIQKNMYTFPDNDPLAVNSGNKMYYRLKMIDFDGKFTYSNIATVNPLVGNNMFSLYPNPVNSSSVYINLSTTVQSRIEVKIEDVKGRIYKKFTFMSNSNSGAIPVDVSKLANGVYVLKVASGKNTYNKQFVVTR